MTLLTTKITEIINESIANSTVVIWRGILDTQEWKILSQYDAEKNEITVRAKRRDDGDGEPE